MTDNERHALDNDVAEEVDEDAEELSRCCGMPLYEDTDICTACGEHN